MSKTVPFIVGLVIGCLLTTACTNSTPITTSNTVQAQFRQTNPQLRVFEWGGCEYVWGTLSNSYNTAVMAHKGNCKYCAERNKPQIKVVREPVFRVPKQPVLVDPNKLPIGSTEPRRVTTQCWWPKAADLPPSLK